VEKITLLLCLYKRDRQRDFYEKKSLDINPLEEFEGRAEKGKK